MRISDRSSDVCSSDLLLKPAAAISFGEVVRIIDGPIAPLPCLSRMAYRACEDCEDEENCVLRQVFAIVHEETARILDGTSLVDALDDRFDFAAVRRASGGAG